MHWGHLHQDFFRDLSSAEIQPLFQKWSKAASWSQTFLPLYEWENILYIGAATKQLESPQSLQSQITASPHAGQTHKVVYLLAPEIELQKLWQQLMQSDQKSSEDPFAFLSTPSSTQTPTEDSLEALMEASSDTDSETPRNEAEENFLETEPSGELPEGLTLTSTSLSEEPVRVQPEPELELISSSSAVTSPAIKELLLEQAPSQNLEYKLKAALEKTSQMEALYLFVKKGKGLELLAQTPEKHAKMEKIYKADLPGAFKVVASSKKSFLGPSKNDSQLMELCQETEFPFEENKTLVTVVPLLAEGEVTHLLLALSNKAPFELKNLEEVEKVVPEIFNDFSTTSSKAA